MTYCLFFAVAGKPLSESVFTAFSRLSGPPQPESSLSKAKWSQDGRPTEAAHMAAGLVSPLPSPPRSFGREARHVLLAVNHPVRRFLRRQSRSHRCTPASICSRNLGQPFRRCPTPPPLHPVPPPPWCEEASRVPRIAPNYRTSPLAPLPAARLDTGHAKKKARRKTANKLPL